MLRVSENRRFLARADGTPFFYLADTAWELFHRLNREEAEYYLRDRAAKGFTVIQAVVLAELDGLRIPNAYGDLPLIDNDPSRPREAYFQHVDFVVRMADTLGLMVCLLATWGDKWNRGHGIGQEIFTPGNAYAFGRWLGHRYRDAPIIWNVGGDRAVQTAEHAATVAALARGLSEGDGGRGLMTFHPPGLETSATWFHEAAWLDFNMAQTGHAKGRNSVDFIVADYARQPVRPCLDGEPGYEGIPADLKVGNAPLTDADVRRFAYQAVFAGACGHTYGCHSVWQMWRAGHEPEIGVSLPWRDALNLPGAGQMGSLRRLLEARPFLTRVPDQSLILQGQAAPPHASHATRDVHGSYAMVYFPQPATAVIDLSCLSGSAIRAAWFDPAVGEEVCVERLARKAARTFQTPPGGIGRDDWVLVLDDMDAPHVQHLPTNAARSWATEAFNRELPG